MPGRPDGMVAGFPSQPYPRYSYPLLAVLDLFLDVLMGGHRDFRRDAFLCVERLKPPLQVLGEENILCRGPCVLTFNHYSRPGFRAWWLALAITAVVPAHIHWIMTSSWRCEGMWYRPILSPVTRWLLPALTRVYDFTAMPAIPPDPRDAEDRARAVRRVLTYVKGDRYAIIGLAPEGGDMPGGILAWPPSGVGRFALLLAGTGLKFIPVGAFEQDGVFCLRFGKVYFLSLLKGLSSQEKDRQAARIVMENIACQLPPHLRGEFA